MYIIFLVDVFHAFIVKMIFDFLGAGRNDTITDITQKETRALVGKYSYRKGYTLFNFFGGHQLNVTIFIIVNLNFKQSLNFSLAILKLNSPDRTPASVPKKRGGNFEVNLLHSFIRGNLYHKFFG